MSKRLISWMAAFLLSFLAINLICMGVARETGGIERDGGAIYAVSQPGKLSINTEEGVGYAKTDSNGYANVTDNLSEDGFVLVLGNSMTRAVNVPQKKTYVYQLSTKFADEKRDNPDETAYVYGISRGGALFAELASGYDAALSEFPGAKAVVIQTLAENRDLGIAPEYLQGIYSQRFYDETQSAEYIFSNEDAVAKGRHLIKNVFPIISFAQNRRLNKLQDAFDGAFGIDWSITVQAAEELREKKQDELQALTDVLAYLNEKNDIPLIILDIPEIAGFDENGVYFNHYYKSTWEQACENAGVTYINMDNVFEKMYLEEHKLPIGFSNTTLGYGHLNVDGNALVANELYKTLKDLEVIE